MPPPSTAGHAAGPWYVAPDGREANPPTGAAGPAEGEFTLVDSGLPALSSTPAAWGDYDNDGDLDILLEGYLNEPWSGGDKVRIYRNVGNGSFVDAYDLPDPYLNPSVAWGGYNNDGWLDILLTDGLLYRNNAPDANTPPSSPPDLAAVMVGGSVNLSWGAASDAQTPSGGLTYNLRVGTRPGSADVVAPRSDTTTGWRRLPEMGNAQTGLSSTLRNLKPGRYFWSVQAVDSAFAGGTFAEEGSFASQARYLPLVIK